MPHPSCFRLPVRAERTTRSRGLPVALACALLTFVGNNAGNKALAQNTRTQNTYTQGGAVLVVTDSRNPVILPSPARGAVPATGAVRVVELDRAPRIEAALSADLPADPQAAAVIVRQRLAGGRDANGLQQRLARAWQDVAEAWGLGVSKLPAVIVDRRYVVYGEPDVARAISRIETYRRAQP